MNILTQAQRQQARADLHYIQADRDRENELVSLGSLCEDVLPAALDTIDAQEQEIARLLAALDEIRAVWLETDEGDADSVARAYQQVDEIAGRAVAVGAPVPTGAGEGAG